MPVSQWPASLLAQYCLRLCPITAGHSGFHESPGCASGGPAGTRKRGGERTGVGASSAGSVFLNAWALARCHPALRTSQSKEGSGRHRWEAQVEGPGGQGTSLKAQGFCRPLNSCQDHRRKNKPGLCPPRKLNVKGTVKLDLGLLDSGFIPVLGCFGPMGGVPALADLQLATRHL